MKKRLFKKILTTILTMSMCGLLIGSSITLPLPEDNTTENTLCIPLDNAESVEEYDD